LLLLGPCLAVLLGGYFYLTSGRYVSTDNAYIKAEKIALSVAVSGSIAEVAVHENQYVEKGDLLFRLDQKPFTVALDHAEAQLDNARNDINALKAHYHQVQQQQQQASLDAQFTEREFHRQARLAKQHVVSEGALDAAQHNLDMANNRIVVLQRELTQLQAQLGGDPDQPLEQHSLYKKAYASRAEADWNLSRSSVTAPFAGITTKTPEVGLYVRSGNPVMSIVSDNQIWIEANFKETELTHLAVGQAVAVSIDSYPDRQWHAVVDSISQATSAEFSVLPAQNSTGNWVKVVQRIPVRIALKLTAEDPPLRAGMSTHVTVDTGYQQPLMHSVARLFSLTDDQIEFVARRGE
jgi:membrane fusion protein (multidrug efflux system)